MPKCSHSNWALIFEIFTILLYTGLAVYMQLSLSYDGGCNAIDRLAPDEVYVLRDGETVTR